MNAHSTMVLGSGQPLFNIFVPNHEDFKYGGVLQLDLVEGVAHAFELMAIDLVYVHIDDRRIFVPWSFA